MFWYSSMFYSEKFKKIIVGTYGKNLVLSIVKWGKNEHIQNSAKNEHLHF